MKSSILSRQGTDWFWLLWQDAMRTFFALPLPVKLGAKRSVDNPRGYYNDEYTKQKLDQKEGFDFGAPVLPDDAEPHRWVCHQLHLPLKV